MKRHGQQRSKAMQESYKYSYLHLTRCPDIIDCELDSLTKGMVYDYMYARLDEKVKNAPVNREIAFLKCVVSRAEEWDMIDNNPLRGLKLSTESEKREVRLTIEEVNSFLEALPYRLSNIVEFAIYTGFRKENILSLRIENIMANDHKVVDEVELIVKGGRKEVFLLGSAAKEVLLRTIDGRDNGYVFTNEKGDRYRDIHTIFNRIVRELGLTVNGTKLRFHDLRHQFAYLLHNQCVSLDMLRPLMGHKDRATTDRYASLDKKAVGDSLSRMPNIRGTGNKKPLTLIRNKG